MMNSKIGEKIQNGIFPGLAWIMLKEEVGK
jgi:hypothetical protein